MSSQDEALRFAKVEMGEGRCSPRRPEQEPFEQEELGSTAGG